MEPRTVMHPTLGTGKLLRTYMGGYEWEVDFESGRRFRLPRREFDGQQERPAEPPAPFPPRPVRVDAGDDDRHRAQGTLETLRLGIVSPRDVETLTIGLEAEGVSLDRALARGRERGGDVLALIGDYGFGKSHFVEIAARRALRSNMLVAGASLDLVETPPGKAREIYRALTHGLRYPDTDERGLGPLLKKALDTPGVVERIAAASPIPERCPLARTLKALESCGDQTSYHDVVEWLSAGAPATPALRACYKKPPTLWTSGEVARLYTYLLTGLSTLAVAVGYAGMAVLIDESEHYSLLRGAQRGRADAFFKALIYAALGPANGRIDPLTIPDHNRVDYPIAFASEPGLFFMFALTDGDDRMPVEAWLAPSQIIRLDDRFIERDIQRFFGTLLRYHALAYDYAPDAARHADVEATVPGLLSRALSQHRVNLRGVIRLAVTCCDLLYLHDDYSSETLIGELRRGLGG